MSKVISEDSARRSLQNLEQLGARSWQQRELRAVWEPLLYEPWVLDIDTPSRQCTVGRREPTLVTTCTSQGGRATPITPTSWVLAALFGCGGASGQEHAGKYGMPGLWDLVDSLGRETWPQFMRGDCNYGSEGNMRQAEARGWVICSSCARQRKPKS
jgi:hypothetical protein